MGEAGGNVSRLIDGITGTTGIVKKPTASSRWRSCSKRAGRKTTPRLAFGSIAELFSAVSEKRLELVRHVATNEGLQIRPLSRALERDYKNVHTDVQALIELVLLEKEGRGGLHAPFDEIVIRAGLRNARRPSIR